KITQEVHKGVPSQNTWDYANRATATLFGSVGAILGFIVPIPGASVLFGAVFGFVGWHLGFSVIHTAREIEPTDTKSIMPWSIRVGVGSTVGATIGGALFFVAGLVVGGPLGAMAG